MSFSGAGSGTEADPYQITNGSELEEVATNPNSVFELTQNISYPTGSPLIQDTYREDGSSEFDDQRIIPSVFSEFSGTLDGNGFNIDGANIQGPDGSSGNVPGGSAYVFSAIGDGGVIKNINFTNHTVDGGNGNTSADGGFGCGLAFLNRGTVKNVNLDSASSVAGGTAGGNLGERGPGSPGPAAGLVFDNRGRIEGCDVTADVSGQNGRDGISTFSSAGGGSNGSLAVGISKTSNGIIQGCTTSGNISAGAGGGGGEDDTGGADGGDGGDAAGIALTQNAKMIQCSSSATITTGAGGSGGSEEFPGGGGDSGSAAGLAITAEQISFCSFTGDINIGDPGFPGSPSRGNGGNGGDTGTMAGLAISAESVENSFSDTPLKVPNAAAGSAAAQPDGGDGERGGDGGDAGDAAGLCLTVQNDVSNSFARVPSTNIGDGGDGGAGSTGSDFEDRGGDGGRGGDASSGYGLVRSGDVENCYVRGSLDVNATGGSGGDPGPGEPDGEFGSTGSDGKAVGVTESGSVTNVYSSLELSASGTQPKTTSSSDISNLFFDSSSAPDNGRGTPLTTSELKVKSNLTGFDFNIDWNLDSTVEDGFANLRGTTPGGGAPPDPEPVVELVNGQVPVVGQTIEIRDNSNAPNSLIQSSEFTFEDGSTTQEKQVTRQLSDDGILEIQLSVTNIEGVTASDTKKLLVTTNAGPGVRLAGAGLLR